MSPHEEDRYPGLNGAIAVITGASGGIGSATARVFARHGATVVLHYNRNASSVDQLASKITNEGVQVFPMQADLTDGRQIAKLFREIEREVGDVKILVNNAGAVLDRLPFLQGSLDLWRKTFDLNVLSVVGCSQAALTQMVRNGMGAIVNVSSISGRTGGVPGESLHYGASKAAVNAFTHALALEVADKGIRVNAVAPGLIETPIHDRFREQFHRQKSGIPLGRAGQADEVAELIAYLASDRASFITGEVFYITGGV